MIPPLAAGTRFAERTIESLLGWGHRGGLYRLDGQDYLKQILLPPLDFETQEFRRKEVEEALESWAQVPLEQALKPTYVEWTSDSLWLILPHVEGEVLALRRPDPPPGPGILVSLARQLLELVLVLKRQQHPLHFQCLDPDHLIISKETPERLICFNPGWSELVWSGRAAFANASPREALSLYGKLLENLAGDAKNLPASLVWMVGRCSSDKPSQNYASFEEIRNSLERLPVFRSQPVFTARQSLDSFPLPGKLVPHLPSGRPGGRLPVLLTATLCLLYLFWFHQQPPALEYPLDLAVAGLQEVRLYDEQGRCSRSWSLKIPILDMVADAEGKRLFLACQGRSELRVEELDSGKVRTLPLESPPVQLFCLADRLLCRLQSGGWCSFQLRPGLEVPIKDFFLANSELPVLELRVGSTEESVLCLRPGLLQRLILSTGECVQEWAEPELCSVVSLEGGMVVARQSGRLDWLEVDFDRVSPVAESDWKGKSQLYPNRYTRQFWRLNSQGKLEVWRYPEPQLILAQRLSFAPRLVADDLDGRLWVVDSKSSLYRLQMGQSLAVEKVLTLEFGPIQALVVLQRGQRRTSR